MMKRRWICNMYICVTYVKDINFMYNFMYQEYSQIKVGDIWEITGIRNFMEIKWEF